MVSLEQVKLLESKVTRTIDHINKVTEENSLLKTKIGSYQKRIDELEFLVQRFKEDQVRIEEGILSALNRLNQFEDALESSLSKESALSRENAAAKEAVSSREAAVAKEAAPAKETAASKEDVASREPAVSREAGHKKEAQITNEVKPAADVKPAVQNPQQSGKKEITIQGGAAELPDLPEIPVIEELKSAEELDIF